MKKCLLYPAAILFFSLLSLSSKAQTSLTLGDIAFTGFNVDAHSSDAGDHFSFVILRTGGITAGTTIRFTDRGWLSGTCGTNGWAATAEGDMLWTSSSALAYGAQVRISSMGTASTGTVTGTAISLAATGDQLFAIQGTIAGVYVMLAGIHMNEEVGVTSATNWDNQVAPTAAQSNRPTCLVDGTHALFINPELDNARIKSTVILSGNPATDRSRVNNAANWDVNDVTAYDLPGSLSGLPVNFLFVKAAERNKDIQVEWEIGVEAEIIDYTVEKSNDGRLYTEVGTVAATGKRSYAWTDIQPHSGANFYRIRATEVSGIFKYSTVVIVNISRNGRGIAVYPTIVRTSQFTLQLTNLPAGNYKLNLQSANGQLVFSRNYVHAGGSATQTITLPATVQNGVYRLNLRGGDENRVTTIVVE